MFSIKPLHIIVFSILSLILTSHCFLFTCIECPICTFQNDIIIDQGDVITIPSYSEHRPFESIIKEKFGIYHCKQCGFSILTPTLIKIFGRSADRISPHAPPAPENVRRAQNIISTFIEQLEIATKNKKKLPCYLIYEIMEKIYLRGFVGPPIHHDSWSRTSFKYDFTDSWFKMKFYLLMGWEYHIADMPEKAKQAWQKATAPLNIWRYEKVPKDSLIRRSLHIKEMEYYLYSGSLNYFLDDPIAALQDYERGLLVKIGPVTEPCYYLDCFYINAQKVINSFQENPFTVLTQNFNFLLLRYFNISASQLFHAFLMWALITMLWILAFGIEEYFSLRKCPNLFLIFVTAYSVSEIFHIVYKTGIQEYSNSILLFSAFWWILYFPGKYFIKGAHAHWQPSERFPYRFQLLYFMTLLAPWGFLYFYNSLKYWEDDPSLSTYSFISLLYWGILAIAVYGTYILVQSTLKKYTSSHMQVFLSLAPIIILSLAGASHIQSQLQFMSEPDWFYMILGVVWLALYLALEYGLTLFFEDRLHVFKRVSERPFALYWYFVRWYFFLFPILVIGKADFSGFAKISNYFLYWGLVTLVIFLLHLLTSKIAQKAKNRNAYWLVTTILSLASQYFVASSIPRNWNDYETAAVLSLTAALFWLSLLLPFQFELKRSPKTTDSHANPLRYFHQNPFRFIIRFSYVAIPAIYGVYNWISLLRQ